MKPKSPVCGLFVAFSATILFVSNSIALQAAPPASALALYCSRFPESPISEFICAPRIDICSSVSKRGRGLCRLYCDVRNCDANPDSRACAVLRVQQKKLVGSETFPCDSRGGEEPASEASPGHLQLVNLSEAQFAPVESTVRFDLVGASFSADSTLIRVFRNGGELPSSRIAINGNELILSDALVEGPNELRVLAADADGKLLGSDVILWAGSHVLQTLVYDEQGLPADGVDVTIELGDDSRVQAKAVSVNGIVNFPDLPNWTVILTARATGNRFSTLPTTGGAQLAEIRLLAFDSPSPIANNDFSQGILGWKIGSTAVQVVPHVEDDSGVPLTTQMGSQSALSGRVIRPQLSPRNRNPTPAVPPATRSLVASATEENSDLVVNTSGEGPRSVSRTFSTASTTGSVLVRYKFITSEVPGGFFGSQFNDSYSVTIRSQSGGAEKSDSNTMNGLGLGAFDSAGATEWRELSLPVSSSGDTAQVDVTVANVADGLYDSQVVVDFVAEEVLRIGADKNVACPNETVVFRPEGNPGGTIAWANGGNPSTGSGGTFETRFVATGDYEVTASLAGGSGTSTDSASVHVNEASGVAWVSRFSDSGNIDDLASPFRGYVSNFINALNGASANVSVSSTRRPKQRAYLMRTAWDIAKNQANPASVPGLNGVDICWLHRDSSGNPDLTASRAAAQAMVTAYNIAFPPAYPTSRHILGLAVDMSITWAGDLVLPSGQGNVVTITSTPRTGAGNTSLHSVGASYGVKKLVTDPPHWSDDGH